jgi:hypothetical protein
MLLYYGTKEMINSHTISSLGIEDGDVFHVIPTLQYQNILVKNKQV